MIHLRLEPRYDADVLVVGGGPAGAATAAHLARAGHEVLLVDRQTFPRDKVCGDFVGPAALLELESLGVGDDPAIRTGNVIEEAGLFVDGRELIRHPIPEVPGLPTFGRVVPRMVLDDVILGAARSAGVSIREATSVTGYMTLPDGVHADLDGPQGRSTVLVKVLVGADGSSSTIARTLRGQVSNRADRILAVRAYYDDVDGPAERSDLYFTSDSFPGYCWLFPTGPATANVGVGMLLETLPPTTEHIKALLLRLVANDRALHSRLKHARLVGKIVGWPLTTFNPRTVLVGDRVLLTGDAAGLINPLNGEGIQYALSSGRWATEVLSRALSAGDVSSPALQPYAERVARELRYDMALARLIIAFISNRTLNPVWMQALAIITARARRDPAYAAITGGVLAGLVPAREVLRPGVLIGTTQQAVSSIGMQIAFTMFRGPAAIRGAATSVGDLVGDLGREGAQDPRGTVRWLAGLAGALGELGIEASRDVIRPRSDSAGVSLHVH